MVLPDGGREWPSFCPGSCVCGMQTSSSSQQQHKTINCDSEALTSPPANMSIDVETLLLGSNRIQPASLKLLVDYDNLTEINLSHNHVYGVGEVTVSLQSLLYLTIDGNELDYLAEKSFWWAPNLRRLSARHNKIELMHEDAFSELTGLRSLILSGNRLFSVISSWFRDLGYLQDLDLSQNNIHAIRKNAFHLLVSLRSLDLSYNQLQHIYDGAFIGLNSLQRITLQGNNIKRFPLVALHAMDSLKEVNMNHNPFKIFGPNAVANLNIVTLLLNHLDKLEFVDSHAFVNLSSLATLELHHNRILSYIDPESFHNVPSLHTLMVQNNNLTLIEHEMLQHLPSMRVLHFAQNGIFCDCNIWWLIDELKDHRRNISLLDGDVQVCEAPTSLKGKTLLDDEVSQMSRTCAPRILPLFSVDYHIDLGDPLRLDCRAVGNPLPQTDWLLPVKHSDSGDAGVMVLRTGDRQGAGVRTLDNHINISMAGTLIVDYAQGPDTGDYTCLASNPRGRDERTAHVNVKTNLADVIILGVSSHSITITWRSRSFEHQYQILYKQSYTNHTYHSTNIEAYMRSFTANELTPRTRYEFCIAMRQGTRTIRINCTTVNTRRKEFHSSGFFNARNYIIGGVIACLLVITIVACTVRHFVKKYNQRKRAHEELYSDNLSQLFLASMDSMSDTTPITYENRGAEMFDDDDIDEIRSTASMPSCSTHTTVIK